MAGSHESNQNVEIPTTSKKSKSKTGKSGHSKSGKSRKQHEQSGQVHKTSGKSGQSQEQSGRVQEQPEQSGHVEQPQQEHSGESGQQRRRLQKKGKKRVQFREESPSKRQRVEEYDDPRVYRDGALEAVSSKFETTKPYFNTGMFIDLDKIDDLGFPHLRPFLEKYMPWLGINQEYNINVLWVFCQSLTAKAKYKKVNGKDQI